MALAIFDLDHTLIKGDSNQAWGELLCELGVVNSEDYVTKSRMFYQQYLDGVLNIHHFLDFVLTPLQQNEMSQLLKWRTQFMQQKIKPLMLSKAQACIQKHQQQGDYTLIITASNHFIVEPIVEAFGVDHTLATNAEIINDQFTGKILGTPSFQEGKIIKLEQWLEQTDFNLTDSYFYSDSYNDLPLLEKVTYPIAVDADQRLTQTAQARNWQHLSFL